MTASIRAAFTAASLLFLPLTAAAQDGLQDSVDENTDRLDELEDLVFDLDTRLGSRPAWLSYSGTEVDLGGHLSTAGTHAKGENSNSTAGSFAFLELYLKARVGEDFSVFGTPGFFWVTPLNLNDAANPTITSTTDLSDITFQRAYGEWHPSDKVNLKVGRFGTGHGVIASEYFVPTKTILLPPMMVRVFGENSLYPQKLDGVRFSGQQSLDGGKRLEYGLYVGVDALDTEEFFSGTRLGIVFEEQGLSVAANAGHGDRTSFTEVTGFPAMFNPANWWSAFPQLSSDGGAYDFYGVDFDFNKGQWRVKSEFYASSEDDGVMDREGWYLQPQYFLNSEWTVAARIDSFDAGTVGEADEIVLGINYNPDPNVRFRLDYAMQDLPAAANADDVDMLLLSASFSF